MLHGFCILKLCCKLLSTFCYSCNRSADCQAEVDLRLECVKDYISCSQCNSCDTMCTECDTCLTSCTQCYESNTSCTACHKCHGDCNVCYKGIDNCTNCYNGNINCIQCDICKDTWAHCSKDNEKCAKCCNGKCECSLGTVEREGECVARKYLSLIGQNNRWVNHDMKLVHSAQLKLFMEIHLVLWHFNTTMPRRFW